MNSYISIEHGINRAGFRHQQTGETYGDSTYKHGVCVRLDFGNIITEHGWDYVGQLITQ